MVASPSPKSSQFTTAGKRQRTASDGPDTKKKQQAVDVLKNDPLDNVVSWIVLAQNNDSQYHSETHT